MTDTGIALSDVPYEATLVADWLTQGKPELGWRGDARLELRVGVVAAASNGYHHGVYRRKGEVLGRNYQVFRHTELGKDELILSRKLDQWDQIIPALVQIDPRTPGFVDTMTKVEKANEVENKHASTAVQEAIGEHVDHLWRLVAERQNGRNTTYQVPGSNPDKQD